MEPVPHPHLSFGIVIPAFEEEQRLPSSLLRLIDWRTHHPETLTHLWIVVEPGTDKTADFVQTAMANHPWITGVFPEKQKGKGAAVRAGLAAATTDIVAFMDADLSTGLHALTEAARRFAETPELSLIAGNRQHPDSRILLRQSGLREFLGKRFNQILRVLGSAPFADTQCGFKAIRRNALEKILPDLTIDGFAFDVELLIVAQSHGLKIEDIAVDWENSPQSKVHLVRDSSRMLRDAIKIRRRLASKAPDRSISV
jgi:dolichyl-phosphate beta-glucosyltransferase